MTFKKLDIILGWVAFAIAAFTYISTMEPTVSFWDCGEFIACSYKLQIGHPPGAPLFLMIGRLFSLGVAPENVAYAVNLISALSSAFTILFLFWTISALGKKIVLRDGDWTPSKSISVLGSSLVGALAYTFSDTFWFSAVEAEVYALSSLLTAIVFWAILRWEQVAEKPGADRWLVFIAYIIGLSIGVHLLNLLAIPAIAFVYYFKMFKPSWKGVVITSVVSVLILGFVQKGVIPGIVEMAGNFELLFVNSMGLSFHLGSAVYAVILIVLIVYAIFVSQKEVFDKWLMLGLLVGIALLVGSFSSMGFLAAGAIAFAFVFLKVIDREVINTGLLCLSVIIIGYSSYAMILVRSNANPPMDENDPENMFAMLSYLNREQYGQQPLAYGPYFNSPLDNQEPYKDGEPVYFAEKESGQYIISDDRKSSIPNYAKEFSTVFPRMWSQESNHIQAYKEWSKYKGTPIRYKTVQGNIETINKPKFSENLRFFFSHQVGWMYWRYFFWNFAGRQNDVQGHGNLLDGNWMSGIGFIDNARLGNQKEVPDALKNNKARNYFYLLPFLLGLVGLFYQFNRDKKDFALVIMLFFFTGLAIILYLNQYPYQPRERDYAYAGSFYAYAIWIGLGVMGLIDLVANKLKLKGPAIAAVITLITLVAVPGLMAKDGWDDHDRSGRTTALDFAKMYLDSCAPNSVLFTNGDNDTFPLWYVQEVEGYRTDVRVINLSLLNTDWYINQMRRKAYDSEPAPFTIPEPKYRQGTRDYVPVIDQNKAGKFVPVKDAVNFMVSDQNMAQLSKDRRMNYAPTKLYSLPVDTQKVLQNGTVHPSRKNEVLNSIDWKINKNFILKKDLLMLDLLANFNWDIPVYYAITTGNDAYIGLQDYFQIEGLAYRLVPFKAQSQDGQTGWVNTDVMYDNVINKFKYGNVKNDGVYIDHNILRMCMNLRNNFSRLADALYREGKTEKAITVLDKCVEEMPHKNVPYDYFMLPITEVYLKLGETEKGKDILSVMHTDIAAELDYYMGMKPKLYSDVSAQAQQSISILYRMNLIAQQYLAEEDLGKQIIETFKRLEKEYSARQGVS
jgi:hypothetical protein